MLSRLLPVLLLSAALPAEVLRVYVNDRTDYENAKVFGPAGAYERITARVHFAADPALPQNRFIRDIDLAPRREDGKVEFQADLEVVKPRESKRGNGTVLFEVSNRGGRGMLNRFSYGGDSEFLLAQGYTLLWVGWQFDVPRKDGLLRLYPPVATENAKPITGPVRSEFIPSAPAKLMPLADRNHIPYAIADPSSAAHTLTVRESYNDRRRPIPRSSWKFTADGASIEMAAGFEPGRIYEAVYQAVNPPVVGLGLAAVRDIVSFFKYGTSPFLLGDQRAFIKRAIGFGVSQSGRFLRTFLYYGCNADERGRKVFDGVWADVAGGGRGSFNHRFAQPSRDGHPYMNLFYQTDLFPFTDLPEKDAVTGVEAGLLDKLAPAVRPKIFYTNGSYEYWGRNAGLIHATLDGKADAPLAPDTRIYFIAGSQHGPGQFPPRRTALNLSNPNDFRPIFRALIVAMEEWVRDGKEPPASQYPRVAAGELVKPAAYKFPHRPLQAWRADYGPEFESKGIVAYEPPKLGAPFVTLVPQADADGIDRGGVRTPEVAVPLGVYTGWNLRAPNTGAPAELADMTGSFFPLTPEQIRQRYGNREAYLERVEQAARALVAARLMLEADIPRVRERSAKMWDGLTHH